MAIVILFNLYDVNILYLISFLYFYIYQKKNKFANKQIQLYYKNSFN